MASTKIKGKRLTLTLDTPGIEVWRDIRSLELRADEPDDQTFGDIADGNSAWFLSGTIAVDTAPGSTWSYIWENAGKRVAFTYAVHGNEEPTEGMPHFVGFVYIARKVGFGNEVNTNSEVEFEWEIDGEPTKITGTP